MMQRKQLASIDMDNGSGGRRSRKPRWRVLAAVLGAVVVLGVVGGAGWKLLRSERQLLVLLQNHVERAAAPGEPVLDTERPLTWAFGHVGLRHPLHRLQVIAGDSRLPPPECTRGECVLVARPTDPVLPRLRAAGLRVTEVEDRRPWDPDGSGRALLGWSEMRVYLLLPTKGSAGP